MRNISGKEIRTSCLDHSLILSHIEHPIVYKQFQTSVASIRKAFQDKYK